MRKLRKSGLFSDCYYLETYPDVAQGGIDPLFHYVVHGCYEERDPNPLFSTGFYLSNYPDVAETCANPLLHYVLHGAEEGRDPSPLFSTLGYLKMYPDVRESGVNPLLHYLERGLPEGRLPGKEPQAPTPVYTLEVADDERHNMVSLPPKPVVRRPTNI